MSWFALDLLDIGFLDSDFSDRNLDMLETDIDSFPVNILLVSKTSGRWPQDIPQRRLENVSWRRLENISWSSLEDMSWRSLEDILEISNCLLSQQKLDVKGAIQLAVNYAII